MHSQETRNTFIDQEKARKLVREHIHGCMSTLITELRDMGIWETEWANHYADLVFPIPENCGCDMDEEEKKEAIENDEELESCGECSREVYEHWAVSHYLARKLIDKGEMVSDFMGILIWARTTTGQAILLDGVIQEIEKEERYVED
jgi:hypothetical protein